MYSVTLEGVHDKYRAYISGNFLGPICVLSSKPLQDSTVEALLKSCKALDYPADPCMFIVIGPEGEQGLSERDVLECIEGLDPYRLIISDENAVAFCSSAYHRSIALEENTTVLERPMIAFASLDSMFSCDEDKRIVWRLLKGLLRT